VCKTLKKRVGQYDFEGAAEDLKQLIASLDVTARAGPPSSSRRDG